MLALSTAGAVVEEKGAVPAITTITTVVVVVVVVMVVVVVVAAAVAVAVAIAEEQKEATRTAVDVTLPAEAILMAHALQTTVKRKSSVPIGKREVALAAPQATEVTTIGVVQGAVAIRTTIMMAAHPSMAGPTKETDADAQVVVEAEAMQPKVVLAVVSVLPNKKLSLIMTSLLVLVRVVAKPQTSPLPW